MFPTAPLLLPQRNYYDLCLSSQEGRYLHIKDRTADKGQELSQNADKCGTPLPLSPTPCSLGWSALPAKERAFPGLSFLICKMARLPVSPSSLGELGPPQPLSLSNPCHVYSAPVVQKGKGPSSESWQGNVTNLPLALTHRPQGPPPGLLLLVLKCPAPNIPPHPHKLTISVC